MTKKLRITLRWSMIALGAMAAMLLGLLTTQAMALQEPTMSRPLDNPVSAVQQADRFVMPAEFEPIASIWMAYPVFENMQGRASQTVQAEMIRAIVSQVPVDLLVQNEAEQKQVEQWLARQGLPKDRIRLHQIPHTDVWMRDMGAIFLKNPEHQLKVADFGFNTWSYYDATDELSMTDEVVDRLIARGLKLPTVRSKLISEGGNREFNGKGVMMATQAVELQRNPGMTLAEIEAEHKNIFNVKKVIWLKQGVVDDDSSFKGQLPGNIFTALTTGGHIDEYARFVDAHTILLAQVPAEEAAKDPIARLTSDRMEENYEILKRATDQDGQPFKILRVPTATPIIEMMGDQDTTYQALKAMTFEDGTTLQDGRKIKVILAASYLNFVIANDVVLVPKYWQPGRSALIRAKDDAVQKIFQQVFRAVGLFGLMPKRSMRGAAVCTALSSKCRSLNSMPAA